VCIRYCGNVSTEPLPSKDKGVFTEPLSSNDRGDTRTDTHTQQRDLIRLLCFFQNTESKLKIREPDVSETVSVSFLRSREETKRSGLSKGPKRVGVSCPHLRTETHPISETLCSLVLEYRTMDRVQKPRNSDNVLLLRTQDNTNREGLRTCIYNATGIRTHDRSV
jgi:hypothetical protein